MRGGDGSTWITHLIDGSFDGVRFVHSSDVDGDGDMDVLGAATLADDITWWENDVGDGSSWTTHLVDGDFDGAITVHSADVDGDGDMDVLGAAHQAHDITWWENEVGDGSTWTAHLIEGDLLGARFVYSADVDGDGDMDIVGTAHSADDITWWENDVGDGSSWTTHLIDGNFDYAVFAHLSDVDGDGDLDVLGAAYEADAITWWENGPPPVTTVGISLPDTVAGYGASIQVPVRVSETTGQEIVSAELFVSFSSGSSGQLLPVISSGVFRHGPALRVEPGEQRGLLGSTYGQSHQYPQDGDGHRRRCAVGRWRSAHAHLPGRRYPASGYGAAEAGARALQ